MYVKRGTFSVKMRYNTQEIYVFLPTSEKEGVSVNFEYFFAELFF